MIEKHSFAECKSLYKMYILERCFEKCSSPSKFEIKAQEKNSKITLNSQAFKVCDSLKRFYVNNISEINIEKECFKDLSTPK